MRFQMPQFGVGKSRARTVPSVFVAVDLGSSSVKYVRLQRRSGVHVLTHFGCRALSRPTGANPESASPIAEVLRACMAEMDMKRGQAAASLSARSTLIRHVEFPQMPLEEMKKSLKINSSPYLHQQYTNYNFDCHIIPPRPVKAKDKETPKTPAKMQVLVGGASTRDVLLCRDALLHAGLVPVAINLAPVALINAFEASHPEMMIQDTVALVDIGFDNSVISIVDKGQAVFTRAVPFGGNQITTHIARTLSIEEKAAEEEKLKMNETVQVFVGSCLVSFARQLRSSIDFFERQHEVPVKRVLCSGGTARSKLVLQFLTDEIGLPCQGWDPTQKLALDLKRQSESDLKAEASNLAVAVGTAVGIL